MPGTAAASDRDTLRWACRQGIPCVVVGPGPGWGRSQLLDLRDSGPRPDLAVALPRDLVEGGRTLPLGVGDAVRVWSVRDGQPWHVPGTVGHVSAVESAELGPVEAARIRLPYRLLATEHRLRGRSEGSGALRVQLAVRLDGPLGDGAAMTLLESWADPDGTKRSRGAAHVVELSRRAFSFSLAREQAPAILPGARLRLSAELPELGLRTCVDAVLRIRFDWDEQTLLGLALGRASPGISDEEHRETLRRAGEAFA